jgi:hypothetical protein
MRGGGGGELGVLSQRVQLYIGAQINFGDPPPYLTYDEKLLWTGRRNAQVLPRTFLAVGENLSSLLHDLDVDDSSLVAGQHRCRSKSQFCHSNGTVHCKKRLGHSCPQPDVTYLTRRNNQIIPALGEFGK